MCLKIYTSRDEIPSDIKFVDYNDLFFNSFTLKDDAITREVLRTIDKATYSSPTTIIGRDIEFGSMYKDVLSTGCKTLLNIIYNPDICFDVVECGVNVLELLYLVKDGHILWDTPVLYYMDDDKECDIIIDNKHFTSFYDFIDYAMDGRKQIC